MGWKTCVVGQCLCEKINTLCELLELLSKCFGSEHKQNANSMKQSSKLKTTKDSIAAENEFTFGRTTQSHSEKKCK